MIHYITTDGVGQAWVGNELRIVLRAGVPFRLHGLRPPQRRYFRSAWVQDLDRETQVIYPIAKLDLLVSLLLAPFLFGPRFFASLINGLVGKRESFKVRLSCLGHLLVACVWARKLKKRRAEEPIDLIHSQWIHSAGTVGMYAAWLLDVPFSFTGHAADIWRERSALEDKVRRAAFIICISTYHRDFYKTLGADESKLIIAYCGIDVHHFATKPHDSPRHEPVKIITCSRLVEKKGYTHLIEACRRLKERGVAFQCLIGGSGPLEEPLRAQIAEAGLEDRVTMTGQLVPQEDLPAFLRDGDIFVLPCVVAADGDADGLPQLLMEAMACGLPVISTRLVGIPDLVVNGESGILLEPEAVDPLVEALERLIADEAAARDLGQKGRQFVERKFDIMTCLEPLLDQYRQRLTSPMREGVDPVEAEAKAAVPSA